MSGQFTLASPAFASGAPIPREYATKRAGGNNISIPLQWTGAPDTAASFALEVVDLDADLWVHWLVIDLPASTRELPAGASGDELPGDARELSNTFGTLGWGGPQPPAGTHEYLATIYALDIPALALPDDVTLDAFRAAIQPHVLASASLSGTLSR